MGASGREVMGIWVVEGPLGRIVVEVVVVGDRALRGVEVVRPAVDVVVGFVIDVVPGGRGASCSAASRDWQQPCGKEQRELVPVRGLEDRAYHGCSC